MLTVSHVAGGWRGAEHHLPCSHNLSWRPGHYWEGTTHCPPPTAIPTLFKGPAGEGGDGGGGAVFHLC